MLTEYSMYVSLNDGLFERVKKVYAKRESLGLDKDQMTLLEDNYRGFVRGGANLSAEDKAVYSKLSEELSLSTLAFSKNVLAATNAYVLNVKDSADLAGLLSMSRLWERKLPLRKVLRDGRLPWIIPAMGLS